MPIEWTIRPAKPCDVDVLARFNCALAEETEGKQLDPPTVHSGVARLIDRPAAGQYLVAEQVALPDAEPDGLLIGCLMTTREWSDWRDGAFVWLQSVYVLPEFRRQGVFKSLYLHLQQEAQADPDICGLRLYVEHDNRAAQTTYAELGMTQTRYHLYEVEFGRSREARGSDPD